MQIQLITTVPDRVGGFINALLGGAVARSLNLDLFGYVVIGTVSGLGGGVLRDTLLRHGPPAALTNVWYLPTALAGAGVAFLVKYSGDQWNRFLLFYLLDAMAISVWAVHRGWSLPAGMPWEARDVIGKVTPTSLSAISRRPLSAWPRGPADSDGEDDDDA